MEGGRLGGGDDVGGGPGARRLGQGHLAIDAERRGDLVDGGVRLRHAALAEIAAGDRDAEAVDALAELPAASASGGRRACAGSRGSSPCSASKTSARSRAERASGPTWSRLAQNGKAPARDSRPKVGFRPNRPQNDAGTRIEPLVSEPSESGDHAGGDRRRRAAGRAARHAARVVRVARGAVVGVLAGEVVGVFAHVERAEEDGAGRLHAARRAVASAVAGGLSRLIFEPARVTTPAMSKRFLTRIGDAGERQRARRRRPRHRPRRLRASARSKVRSVKAPRRGLVPRSRSSAASAISRAETRPALTAAAISCAGSSRRTASSRLRDRRRPRMTSARPRKRGRVRACGRRCG